MGDFGSRGDWIPVDIFQVAMTSSVPPPRVVQYKGSNETRYLSALETVYLPAAVQSLSMISAPARRSPKANS